MPAPAPSSRVKYDATWVGTAPGGVKLRMSCAARTSTQARAKCSDTNRRSWATTTPDPPSPAPGGSRPRRGHSGGRCGRCNPRRWPRASGRFRSGSSSRARPMVARPRRPLGARPPSGPGRAGPACRRSTFLSGWWRQGGPRARIESRRRSIALRMAPGHAQPRTLRRGCRLPVPTAEPDGAAELWVRNSSSSRERAARSGSFHDSASAISARRSSTRRRYSALPADRAGRPHHRACPTQVRLCRLSVSQRPRAGEVEDVELTARIGEESGGTACPSCRGRERWCHRTQLASTRPLAGTCSPSPAVSPAHRCLSPPTRNRVASRAPPCRARRPGRSFGEQLGRMRTIIRVIPFQQHPSEIGSCPGHP